MNSNIIKTQIFYEMKYDLKGQIILPVYLKIHFFLIISKLDINANTMKVHFLHLIKLTSDIIKGHIRLNYFLTWKKVC